MVLLLGIASGLGPLATGCARTLPPDPSAGALYRDLERLVSLRQATGWQIDRIEIEALLPDALMSTCQVEPARRVLLRDWLDARIAALGGPVDKAFRERGQSLERVSDLLALTRVRMTLDRAMSSADADCPFWLAPRPLFRGRQISDDRWTFSLGGGGKGILVSQGDKQDLEFGGASRLMFGRNMGHRVALYTGLEAGASASIPEDELGQRTSLILAVDVGVPLVMRYHLVNSYFEAEAGYLLRSTDADWGDVEHGMHVGVAFGGRAARVRWFFPGAVLGVSYERTFPGDEPALHMIKIGARAAFDFDL